VCPFLPALLQRPRRPSHLAPRRAAVTTASIHTAFTYLPHSSSPLTVPKGKPLGTRSTISLRPFPRQPHSLFVRDLSTNHHAHPSTVTDPQKLVRATQHSSRTVQPHIVVPLPSHASLPRAAAPSHIFSFLVSFTTTIVGKAISVDGPRQASTCETDNPTPAFRKKPRVRSALGAPSFKPWRSHRHQIATRQATAPRWTLKMSELATCTLAIYR
jgi:hypothetical protein